MLLDVFIESQPVMKYETYLDDVDQYLTLTD